MERKQKRFLGLLGLFAVIAMTVVAAVMPGPGASAKTTSITDNLSVKVVDATPMVDLQSDVDGGTTSFPNFKVDIDYANVEEINIYQTYIDSDGVASEKEKIATYKELGGVTAGTITNQQFTVYEYGKYIISSEAVAKDGSLTVPDDYIVFEYVPVIASIKEDPVTGDYGVTIESHGDDVETVEVYLDGTLIGTLSGDNIDQTVTFSMADKPSGTYTVMVVAKDADGNILYIPLTFEFKWEAAEVPDAGTPDTGGLFKNLNISKEDYLTTGLIVFFILGIVAFGAVSRKSNSKK